MSAFIVLYAIAGVIVGIIAGLLGLGGGVVIIPILNVAFTMADIDPAFLHKLTLGTSMGCILFTSVSSTLAHHKRGSVLWRAVLTIAPGILVGTFAGSFVAARMPARPLQILFACFLLYVSYTMFRNAKPKPSRRLPGKAGMTAAGLGIGSFSSLVGIGGGTLSVPYLLYHNVEMRHAVGTSAAIGFPIAVGGVIGYVMSGLAMAGLPEHTLGFIYLPALVPLVCMSTLFAPLGAGLAHSMPVAKLKKCFAVFLVCMAAKMFTAAM